MPTNNLIEDHYTDGEKAEALKLLQTLSDRVKPRTRNLTPEERQKYGSIREQTKLLVQKDMDYHFRQPQLDCADVDWKELEADYADRTFLEALASMLEGLRLTLENTRILHDYDCYQNVLTDYHYSKFKAESTQDPGWETKFNDLKQFMPGTGGNSNKPAENTATQPTA